MPKTGNKFNDLYQLSKNLKEVKTSQDKSTVEYEFEKSKDECTFKPQTMKPGTFLKDKKTSLQPSGSLHNF